MRKLLILLLALSLITVFCGCGNETVAETTQPQITKSEQAQKCDELILAIGDVTLDSLAAIEEAELHYEALTEAQKNEVENNVILLQARKNYDKLVEEESKKLTETEEIILEYAKTIKDLLADSDSFELKKAQYCEGVDIAILEVSGSNALGGSSFETFYFWKSLSGDLSMYQSGDSFVKNLKNHMEGQELEEIDCEKIMLNME